MSKLLRKDTRLEVDAYGELVAEEKTEGCIAPADIRWECDEAYRTDWTDDLAKTRCKNVPNMGCVKKVKNGMFCAASFQCAEGYLCCPHSRKCTAKSSDVKNTESPATTCMMAGFAAPAGTPPENTDKCKAAVPDDTLRKMIAQNIKPCGTNDPGVLSNDYCMCYTDGGNVKGFAPEKCDCSVEYYTTLVKQNKFVICDGYRGLPICGMDGAFDQNGKPMGASMNNNGNTNEGANAAATAGVRAVGVPIQVTQDVILPATVTTDDVCNSVAFKSSGKSAMKENFSDVKGVRVLRDNCTATKKASYTSEMYAFLQGNDINIASLKQSLSQAAQDTFTVSQGSNSTVGESELEHKSKLSHGNDEAAANTTAAPAATSASGVATFSVVEKFEVKGQDATEHAKLVEKTNTPEKLSSMMTAYRTQKEAALNAQLDTTQNDDLVTKMKFDPNYKLQTAAPTAVIAPATSSSGGATGTTGTGSANAPATGKFIISGIMLVLGMVMLV